MSWYAPRADLDHVTTVDEKDARVLAKLREIVDGYAEHQSWRCTYRSRYGRCVCGLDELLAELGMEPVPVQDPEALRG